MENKHMNVLQSETVFPGMQQNMPITLMEGAKTVAVACATVQPAREMKAVKIRYSEID